MSEALTEADRARYSRHLLLPQLGEAGQSRLKSARVLLVGLGGLGSPCALYLAAAGVGTLGLADNDTVALHNLQRQILHRDADVGRPKVETGAATLRALNPTVRLVAHPEGVTPENALSLFSGYDVIVDGSDNFATRYLVNDAAVLAKKPLVAGSVFRFEGQLAVFDTPAGGPCYRCLFPEPPAPGSAPACGEAGVLGALPGVIGAMQAMEVVKLITGAGEPLRGRLFLYDGLAARSRTLSVPRNPECPCCGARPTLGALDPARYGAAPCAAPAGRGEGETPLEIDVAGARALASSSEPPLLLDVREAHELRVCRLAAATHIPMGEIPDRLSELPMNRRILVLCHHGGRSLRVTRFLRDNGFPRTTNIRGGIDRWAVEIDSSLRRY